MDTTETRGTLSQEPLYAILLQTTMRTNLNPRNNKSQSLEDTVSLVKAFFSEFCINPKENRVLIAMEEDKYNSFQLQVDSNGNLVKVGVSYTSDDDAVKQYEKIVTNPNTETMQRVFYGEDTVTVREWFSIYRLQHTIIPEAYHPLC